MVRYSDSEVRVFHPICEKALNNAITNLGQSRMYQVIHHRYTGSLEMDFVIENKTTGKYLCVVEVKRTPSDVQSTRYQFQAQSYVQMNTAQNEKPFYIITNLEALISFRYDASKPRVYQQMLQPGLEHICDFTTDNDSAIESKLTTAFERLNRYLGMVPLSAGMRNAQHDVFELSSGDSEFIDFTAMTATMATNVINDYIPLQRVAEGQSRNTTKPPAEIKKIAERYARVVFQANSVLVPTKLRRTGRVHVTRVPMHISTNFAVFTYGTANEANIIGSYMSTIFYQLECEVQSKDHAGLRKLELQDVQTTHVPIVSSLTTAEIARVNAELPNIQFLDLNNPVIRNIDLIWADILYGTNANAVLNDAIRLLRFLANRRNP